MKTSVLSLALAVLASAGARLQAQQVQFPPASPASKLVEHVGLTTIEIDYSRPGVKGRKVFGGLVPYGQVWRTGANAATKVTFSTEVLFGGEVVPAGTYGLFTVPGEKQWTVILNKGSEQWGSYNYSEGADVARVTGKVAPLTDPVETFTITVQDIGSQTANLVLAWEKTMVKVEMEVDVVGMLVPQIEAAMAGDGEKPYFAAAMFYYEHDLDLKKAAAWMEAACKAQPDQMWMIYRQGLILAKAGDKAGATAAANTAKGLAQKAGGELGDEYTRLCDALLAKLK
jgi:hypothetical protein